jgi:hypothetical protein
VTGWVGLVAAAGDGATWWLRLVAAVLFLTMIFTAIARRLRRR